MEQVRIVMCVVRMEQGKGIRLVPMFNPSDEVVDAAVRSGRHSILADVYVDVSAESMSMVEALCGPGTPEHPSNTFLQALEAMLAEVFQQGVAWACNSPDHRTTVASMGIMSSGEAG